MKYIYLTYVNYNNSEPIIIEPIQVNLRKSQSIKTQYALGKELLFPRKKISPETKEFIKHRLFCLYDTFEEAIVAYKEDLNSCIVALNTNLLNIESNLQKIKKCQETEKDIIVEN